MNKFGAKKTTIAGIVFDSKREAQRYAELVLLERAGKIRGLQRQVQFQLAPKVKINGEKRQRPALRYTADFEYYEAGYRVVEDIKGAITQTFRIRQHLMKTVHGIDVRVVK